MTSFFLFYSAFVATFSLHPNGRNRIPDRLTGAPIHLKLQLRLDTLPGAAVVSAQQVYAVIDRLALIAICWGDEQQVGAVVVSENMFAQ